MPRRSDQPNTAPRYVLPGAPPKRCGTPPRSSIPTLLSILTLPLLVLSGCYTYAETSLTEISPGLSARVTLDEDGFGRVVNQAASNGVPVDVLDMTRRAFTGRVTALGSGNMTVELRSGGGSVFAAEVPMQSVEQVALRTFNRKRTIGAVAGGAILFAAVLNGTMGGTTSPGLPPEPEQLVAPTAHGIQIGSRLAVGTIIEAFARLSSSR